MSIWLGIYVGSTIGGLRPPMSGAAGAGAVRGLLRFCAAPKALMNVASQSFRENGAASRCGRPLQREMMALTERTSTSTVGMAETAAPREKPRRHEPGCAAVSVHGRE
jgi:hypothetical protein